MTFPARPPGTGAVLEVEDLSVALRTAHGIRRAVNGISFSIGQGEILGIAGESGSGKTLTRSVPARPSPPGCPDVGERPLRGTRASRA